jgi:Cytochrome P460
MRRLLILGVVVLSFSTGCSRTPPDSELFNAGAALPASAPVQALDWKVITSSIDATHETMSTLFGNDLAVASARMGKSYPGGSVLSFVTWSQQEDRHWFGGKIPKQVQSIEVVTVTQSADGKTASSYERFEGQGLARTVSNSSDLARMEYLLSQRASVMP